MNSTKPQTNYEFDDEPDGIEEIYSSTNNHEPEISRNDEFGETEATISYLDEMKNVADYAESSYSQLSTLQLQIAKAQPTAPPDMLDLLAQAITRTQARIPALERSIQEVKMEWNLS